MCALWKFCFTWVKSQGRNCCGNKLNQNTISNMALQHSISIHVETQEPIRAPAALMHCCMVTRIYRQGANLFCRNRQVPAIMCTWRDHTANRQTAHHLPQRKTGFLNGKCYVRIRRDMEIWQDHLFAMCMFNLNNNSVAFALKQNMRYSVNINLCDFA